MTLLAAATGDAELTRDAADGRTRSACYTVGNFVVEWIDPPHFFAKGRIIALTLGDDAHLLGPLTRVLVPR